MMRLPPEREAALREKIAEFEREEYDRRAAKLEKLLRRARDLKRK